MRSDYLFFFMSIVLIAVMGTLTFFWKSDKINNLFTAAPATFAVADTDGDQTVIFTRRPALRDRTPIVNEVTVRDPFQVDAQMIARNKAETQEQEAMGMTLASAAGQAAEAKVALRDTRADVLGQYGQPMALSQDRNTWMYEDRVFTFKGDVVESTVLVDTKTLEQVVAASQPISSEEQFRQHRPATPSISGVSTSTRARVIKGVREGMGPRVIMTSRVGGGTVSIESGPARASHYRYQSKVNTGLGGSTIANRGPRSQ